MRDQLKLTIHTFLTRTNTPILATVIGSLALSLIALYFNPILGRDSALYLDIAKSYTSTDISELLRRFNWPWMSILIAQIHTLTGFSIINSGYLINGALMAGTCAAITKATQLMNPSAAWWACLASLSIPAFNVYRDHVVREAGFWMFGALTLILVILWSRHRDIRHLLLSGIMILLSAIFRLEAVFLFGPLLTVVLAAYLQNKSPRIILSLMLFVLIFCSGMIYLATKAVETSERAQYYLGMINPARLVTQLHDIGVAFASSSLEKYSQDDAAIILVFGFAGLILWRAALLAGPFLIPALLTRSLKIKDGNKLPLVFITAAIVSYLAVLMTFFIQQRFMIDRYISLLHVLAVPILAIGALQFSARYPRTGRALIVVAILCALSNVVSLSPKRTHYLLASAWISNNLPLDASVYYADGRIAFYADRGYLQGPLPEEHALTDHSQTYQYFVFEELQLDSAFNDLLAEHQLQVLAEFTNGQGRHLAIVGPRP